MKQENKEIVKIWLAQFDERLAWLDQQIEDMTVNERIAISAALSERRKQLGDYCSVMDEISPKAINDKGVKSVLVESLDGGALSVECSNRPTRADIRRDQLLDAVNRLALSDEHRTDKMTGERASVEATQVRLLNDCFRLEPRWSDLAKVGINADEYSQTTWKRSIKITKTVEL